jgi:uncharacterized protein YegP (UPF0339 family)
MLNFMIYIDPDGDYRWYLTGENNRRIADSAEGYRRRMDCEHSIRLMKLLAPTAKIEMLPRVETLLEV